MIPRRAAPVVQRLSRGYPVVAITGPRQSGKTTLARAVFPDHDYVSLEDLDRRDFARVDPRGFLAQHDGGAVLDEVQRAPELLSYLQGVVDENPAPGRFILTGSQQFGLLSDITQTLAGRVAMVELLPFSLGELAASELEPPDLETLLFAGLYPPIHDRGLDPATWYGNYVRTYLERDLRQMVNVRDLSVFRRFLRMCAARSGQLVNLSSLAADCGISHNTAKAWLSVLEASFLVHLLPPHHRNFTKRLIKTPKLYFLDSGLATHLLGVENREDLATHSMRGPLFEGWVCSELLKARYNRASEPHLYFWRSHAGLEVDFLVERGDELTPIEVKSGSTVAGDFLRSLEEWVRLANSAAGERFLVYGGDGAQIRRSARVLPWRRVPELAEDLAAR